MLLSTSTTKFNSTLLKPLSISVINKINIFNKSHYKSFNNSSLLNVNIISKRYNNTDAANDLTAPKQGFKTEKNTSNHEHKKEKKEKKRLGFLSGGMFGFLLGFSTVFGIGYYYLIQDYQISNDSLRKSIDTLQGSIIKIKRNNREVDELIEELKKLKDEAVTKDEFNVYQQNFKTLLDEIKKEQTKENSNLSRMNDNIAKNLQQKNNFNFFLPTDE
ncbi:hypothetical protein BCR32DRAFT_270414 [Anaeromyces robustus]|uniref:Transmembrane protein n=1 Tax=Anaeromyces robustus TaxID=1754192 RepID=A0A1Y1WX92_9FUNG|nr:hypothetical protein BCR32DRAFT_270414 [Anaeromyces robustus]|eukprot:ORX77826.1 hypothetical protein BCR32DRAFT_270414 [Anaeromyces robustus]